jgi:hypothetical protein
MIARHNIIGTSHFHIKYGTACYNYQGSEIEAILGGYCSRYCVSIPRSFNYDYINYHSVRYLHEHKKYKFNSKTIYFLSICDKKLLEYISKNYQNYTFSYNEIRIYVSNYIFIKNITPYLSGQSGICEIIKRSILCDNYALLKPLFECCVKNKIKLRYVQTKRLENNINLHKYRKAYKILKQIPDYETILSHKIRKKKIVQITTDDKIKSLIVGVNRNENDEQARRGLYKALLTVKFIELNKPTISSIFNIKNFKEELSEILLKTKIKDHMTIKHKIKLVMIYETKKYKTELLNYLLEIDFNDLHNWYMLTLFKIKNFKEELLTLLSKTDMVKYLKSKELYKLIKIFDDNRLYIDVFRSYFNKPQYKFVWNWDKHYNHWNYTLNVNDSQFIKLMVRHLSHLTKINLIEKLKN